MFMVSKKRGQIFREGYSLLVKNHLSENQSLVLCTFIQTILRPYCQIFKHCYILKICDCV